MGLGSRGGALSLRAGARGQAATSPRDRADRALDIALIAVGARHASFSSSRCRSRSCAPSIRTRSRCGPRCGCRRRCGVRAALDSHQHRAARHACGARHSACAVLHLLDVPAGVRTRRHRAHRARHRRSSGSSRRSPPSSSARRATTCCTASGGRSTPAHGRTGRSSTAITSRRGSSWRARSSSDICSRARRSQPAAAALLAAGGDCAEAARIDAHLARVAVCVMTLAVLLSASRSGLIGLMCAFVHQRWLSDTADAGTLAVRRWVILQGALLVLVVISFANFDALLRAVRRDRCSASASGTRANRPSGRDAERLIRDFPLTGTGAGTFGTAISRLPDRGTRLCYRPGAQPLSADGGRRRRAGWCCRRRSHRRIFLALCAPPAQGGLVSRDYLMRAGAARASRGVLRAEHLGDRVDDARKRDAVRRACGHRHVSPAQSQDAGREPRAMRSGGTPATNNAANRLRPRRRGCGFPDRFPRRGRQAARPRGDSAAVFAHCRTSMPCRPPTPSASGK